MRCGFKFSKLPDPCTFLTEPGSPIRTVYAPIIEDGTLRLVENGKQNIQTLIDSYRETTDMTFIIARLTAGDASPLYACDGFYADVSNMSWNPAEMLQNIIDARTYFDSLPKEIREKFDFDFKKWFGSAGSEEWVKGMTNIKEAPLPQSQEPVEKPVEKPVEPENKVVE